MDDLAQPRKNYAILRFGKIRSWATLRLVEEHNTRKTKSENLINDTPPKELLKTGGDDFVRLAEERMEELFITKPSARGKILAVEAITSASRRWFEAANDEQKEDWVARNLAWAREKFGRGLLSAKLHLDEEVWHIHFIAIPAVEKAPKKRGRPFKEAEAKAASEALWNTKAKRWTLSYEDLLGGHKMNLSREQDRYHATVADLGLERGEKNPDVIEIELGDELTVALAEWQKGLPRKNIPPQEYRKLIKKLHRDAEAAVAKVKEREREMDQREASIADRESGLAEREKETEIQRSLLVEQDEDIRDREEMLQERERQLKAGQADLDERAHAVERDEERINKTKNDVAQAEAQLNVRDAKVQQREAAAEETSRILDRARQVTDAKIEAANKKKRDAEALLKQAETAAMIVEQDARLQVKQLKLLARTMDSRSGISLAIVNDRITFGGVTTEEDVAASKGPWQLLGAGVRAVAAQLVNLKNKAYRLSEQTRAINAREAKIDEREAAITSRANELTAAETRLENRAKALASDEAQFETEKSALERTIGRAMAFLEAWKLIPAAERSPAVDATLQAAAGLTSEELPLGFSLPGKGGQQR